MSVSSCVGLEKKQTSKLVYEDRLFWQLALKYGETKILQNVSNVLQ